MASIGWAIIFWVAVLLVMAEIVISTQYHKVVWRLIKNNHRGLAVCAAVLAVVTVISYFTNIA